MNCNVSSDVGAPSKPRPTAIPSLYEPLRQGSQHLWPPEEEQPLLGSELPPTRYVRLGRPHQDFPPCDRATETHRGLPTKRGGRPTPPQSTSSVPGLRGAGEPTAGSNEHLDRSRRWVAAVAEPRVLVDGRRRGDYTAGLAGFVELRWPSIRVCARHGTKLSIAVFSSRTKHLPEYRSRPLAPHDRDPIPSPCDPDSFARLGA